jgi:uncharacterized protein (DUF1499 family)
MAAWTEILTIGVGSGFLSLKLLASWSQLRCAARGLEQGILSPQLRNFNMACSEGELANFLPPPATSHEPWDDLQDVVESLSGRLVRLEATYLHAVFKTPIWGFEEDLEARFDRAKQRIHLRSSARVGYSDSGSNSKRIDALKRLVAA